MVLGFGWSQEASKPDPPTRSGSLEFWSGMTSDEIFLEWANQTSAGVLAGWVRGVHENEVLDVFFSRRYLPLTRCIYNANPTQLVLLVYSNKQSSATAAWIGIIIPSLHSSEHMLCILALLMGGDITREVWSIISHPTVLDPFTESIKSFHMCEVLWCWCVQKQFCRLRTLRARGSQSKQANEQNKHPVQRFRGQVLVWLYSQLWVQVVVCKFSLWRMVFRYFIRNWVRAHAGLACFGQGIIPPFSSYLFKVSEQDVFLLPFECNSKCKLDCLAPLLAVTIILCWHQPPLNGSDLWGLKNRLSPALNRPLFSCPLPAKLQENDDGRHVGTILADGQRIYVTATLLGSAIKRKCTLLN